MYVLVPGNHTYTTDAVDGNESKTDASFNVEKEQNIVDMNLVL